MRRLVAVLAALVLVAAFAPTVAAGGLRTDVKIVITYAAIPGGPGGDLELGYFSPDLGNVVIADNYSTTAAPQVMTHRISLTLDLADAMSFSIWLEDTACYASYHDNATNPDHWTLVEPTKGQTHFEYFADSGAACVNKSIDVAPSSADYQGMVKFIIRGE